MTSLDEDPTRATIEVRLRTVTSAGEATPVALAVT